MGRIPPVRHRSGAPGLSLARLRVFVCLAGILVAGCASPSALQRTAPDPQTVASVHPSSDQVLATPVQDPLQRLLAPSSSPPAVNAPVIDPVALAYAVHDQVNAVRAAHRLSPLAWYAPLAPVAQAHSLDMAEHAYFGHMNLLGQDATARAREAGVKVSAARGSLVFEGIGENLFLTHRFWEYRVYTTEAGARVYDVNWKTVDDLARQTVDSWMASRTHRTNLLCSFYTAQAIGVVIDDHQTIFVTQNFVSAPLQ